MLPRILEIPYCAKVRPLPPACPHPTNGFGTCFFHLFATNKTLLTMKAQQYYKTIRAKNVEHFQNFSIIPQ